MTAQGGGRPTPGAGRLRADVAHLSREFGAAALTIGPQDRTVAALGANSSQPRSKTVKKDMQSFLLDRHADLQRQKVPCEKRGGAKSEVPLRSVGRYGAAQSGEGETYGGDR